MVLKQPNSRNDQTATEEGDRAERERESETVFREEKEKSSSEKSHATIRDGFGVGR